MIIHITPDELKEEYRESWKLGLMKHPSIDYANMISAGAAGITILIEANK